MSDSYWFPPLDEGATVASNVIPAEHLTGIHAIDIDELCDVHPDGCDLVVLSVPAGDGLAVETAARRMLRVRS